MTRNLPHNLAQSRHEQFVFVLQPANSDAISVNLYYTLSFRPYQWPAQLASCWVSEKRVFPFTLSLSLSFRKYGNMFLVLQPYYCFLETETQDSDCDKPYSQRGFPYASLCKQPFFGREPLNRIGSHHGCCRDGKL